MIPAILAAPLVQGVVGGLVGGVMNAFAPTPSMTADSSSFNPMLNRASAAAATAATPGPTASPSGTMRSGDWSAMSSTDVHSWAQSLAGKHVDATDNSGRTISGAVQGVQMLGTTLALNIGGHLVSLAQLKQISWSPSVV